MTVLAAYGRHEVLEGPDVEGVVILRFLPSMPRRRGTTVPPIARYASIAFEAPTIAG